MCKVYLRAPLFNQSEVFKLRAVVNGNTFENIGKAVTIFGMEGLHGGLHCFAGLAWNTHGDIVVSHSLNKGEYDRFFAVPESNNCVSFPVTQLNTGGNLSGAFLNAAAFGAFVDMGPVKKVTGFSTVLNPVHKGQFLYNGNYGKEWKMADGSVQVGSLLFESGAVGTIHFNGESCNAIDPLMIIFGTEGYLTIGNPDGYDATVTLTRKEEGSCQIPFTHDQCLRLRIFGRVRKRLRHYKTAL